MQNLLLLLLCYFARKCDAHGGHGTSERGKNALTSIFFLCWVLITDNADKVFSYKLGA